MTTINRKYKDRLFRYLFGSSERKEYTLEPCNALNGTSYEDPGLIEINTIEDAIYLSMRNDVSFLIDWELHLYEHRSTWNPNLPIRGLLYFAKEYDRIIKLRELNVYGSKRIELPAPRFVIFYNSQRAMPVRQVLRLTDAFPEQKRPGSSIEMTALMININTEAGDALLEQCRALREYAFFVSRIREKMSEGMSLEDAAAEKVDTCIREDIMAELLLGHKSEVIDMLITEYNEGEVLRLTFRDGKAEGRAEGRAEGKHETLASLVLAGKLEAADAADAAGMTLEEFAEILEQEDSETCMEEVDACQ